MEYENYASEELLWICPQCKFENKAVKIECEKCNYKRKDEDNDWICKECNIVTFFF